MLRPSFVAVVLAAIATTVGSAFGGIYTLTFDGVFDFNGTGQFDDSPTVPFHFELTIDPSLNTNTAFVPAGENTEAFYGFSKSSLVSTSLTFDTFTWTALDIQESIPVINVGADFFLNTDLVSGAPSNIWLLAQNDYGDLQLGGAFRDLSGLHYYDRVSLDFADFHSQVFSNGLVTLTTAAIPEPSTVAMTAGLAAFATACYVRRRRA